MEKIRKFDEEFRNIYKDAFLYAKIGSGILSGIGLFCMLFPFELSDHFTSISWMGCAMCVMGISQYMRAYFSIREGDKMVSVYEKFACLPVTKKEIRKVRLEYMNHICIKISTAAFVIQQMVSMLNHSFGVVSVLFAVVWAAVLWILSLMIVYQF